MKALVLGSGGMRVAYHVGVICRLAQRGERFDLYAGSSAGALVAAIAAQYNDKQVPEMITHLKKIVALETSDVWQNWRPFKWLAAGWKTGALDSAPLEELIRFNVIPSKLKASGKKLVVGAVNVRTGESRSFGEAHPQIVKAVTASAAIPGIFCPVEIEHDLWWDAATRSVAPVRAAILAGASEVVASLLTPTVRRYGASPVNVVEAIGRATDIAGTEILEGDLLAAQLYTKLALAGHSDKRPVTIRIVRPSDELILDGSLDLIPATSKRLFDLGYRDATTI